MWEDGAGSFRALGLVKDFARGSRQPLNDFKQRKDAGHAVFGKDGCGCPVENELEKRRQ